MRVIKEVLFVVVVPLVRGDLECISGKLSILLGGKTKVDDGARVPAADGGEPGAEVNFELIVTAESVGDVFVSGVVVLYVGACLGCGGAWVGEVA